MLLAIDIGNTSIKFGIFDGEALAKQFLIPTRRDYAAAELDSLAGRQIAQQISRSVAVSVVPEVDEAISGFVSHFLDSETVFVRNDFDFGLTINYQPLASLGTDRLVNSFAAAEKYGVPCIVVSLGTATTIDVIDRNREFLGGLIAPGMATSAKALASLASKLPEVEIAEPLNVIGTTTAASIQSGVFYSQAGLIETAVRHIRSEIARNAQVIATGGFAYLVARKCQSIDTIDPDLTLDGLRMLYSRRHPEK